MSPSVSVHFLQTQSDARLLALARRGHERAFEALVRRYRKPLVVYCRRLLLPEARAEDAVQQALLAAWIALERGDEVRDVRAWLFRIAHNTALNARRGSRYDYAQLNEALVGAPALDADLDRRIAIREALAGVAALPPMQREALLRTAIDGRSHDEVAAAMGLSDGALRGLVYRARATLRSAATALTPPWLVSWVASSASTHGDGVAALIKGGAVALTAGTLVVGAVAVHEQRPPQFQTEGKAHASHPSRASRTDSGMDTRLTSATPRRAIAVDLLAARSRARVHRLGSARDEGVDSQEHGHHGGERDASETRHHEGDRRHGSGHNDRATEHPTAKPAESGDRSGSDHAAGSEGHD